MRARYIYPTCKRTKSGARDLRVQRTPRNKRQKAREPAEEREDKRDRCFAEEQEKKKQIYRTKGAASILLQIRIRRRIGCTRKTIPVVFRAPSFESASNVR